MRHAICIIGILLATHIGCQPPPESNDGKLTIAVIPKGETHVHWTSVRAGAEEAAEAFDVEVQWKGPTEEDDRANQIQLVRQFISDEVDGICLAPLDSRALVAPVKQAVDRELPVVIFASDLQAQVGEDYVSYVATHNRKGGEMAGEELVRLLGGKGKVLLLRYDEGSESTEQREAGFLEALSKHPEIEVISENQYAGATVDTAKTKALNIIDEIRKADAVFTPNESSTLGMLLALRQERLIDELVFVGFDASPKLIDGLASGDIAALIAQDPRTMGYEVIRVMVEHLRGEPVEEYVDTGAYVITQENLDDPKIKKLLSR